MNNLPVVQKAAGYFYDLDFAGKPDHDCKAPFYFLDAELNEQTTYEEFSTKSSLLV